MDTNKNTDHQAISVKGGKARWKGISKKERSAIMAEIASRPRTKKK
jgi:hypothetical protein